MRNLIMKEGAVWLTLVVLTMFGFYNYDTQGSSVAFIVLAVGFAKFFLIFCDFMEMKHAHRVWPVSMSLFLIVLFAALSFTLASAKFA